MAHGEPVKGSLFIYAPNKWAPVIFAVGFAALGLIHTWQCRHYNCFKTMWLHLVCCFMFTAGFALRQYGSFNYIDSEDRTNLYFYIGSTCLIYMAPPLLELANYHILGRVLFYVPYHSPMHPGRVLTTFGMLSVVVEVMNALGVSNISNNRLPEDRQKLGHILMKTSLIVQVAVLLLFCVLAGLFQYRCAKGNIRSKRVSAPLWTLYASTLLILVRCIYRIIEHFGISSINPTNAKAEDLSPILRYEWFFYGFEATLMLINNLLWSAMHPRRYLPQHRNIYLAQDGVTELEGPGWKDNRSFLVTLLDPFGWLDSKKDQPPFWEKNGHAKVQDDHV
ncbi:RTA1 domain-containing protein [Aspergillus affinis]|uniref:RTA1 domain-containing protein n=1 Tax=Aspergillus affinis TaxID=1070780 RepID=UPI0022FE23CE|nr:uncharacterized protein KD926_010983 [Aspergillus affinis]KAI9044811.1 hypothetical protein KD926_010983 [Aspergillus affinis]